MDQKNEDYRYILVIDARKSISFETDDGKEAVKIPRLFGNEDDYKIWSLYLKSGSISRKMKYNQYKSPRKICF